MTTTKQGIQNAKKNAKIILENCKKNGYKPPTNSNLYTNYNNIKVGVRLRPDKMPQEVIDNLKTIETYPTKLVYDQIKSAKEILNFAEKHKYLPSASIDKRLYNKLVNLRQVEERNGKDIHKSLKAELKKISKYPTKKEYTQKERNIKLKQQKEYVIKNEPQNFKEYVLTHAFNLPAYKIRGNNVTKNMIDKSLGVLNNQEKIVLQLRGGYYGNKMTLQETGDHLKLTRERIRVIESKAFNKIRSNQNALNTLKGIRNPKITKATSIENLNLGHRATNALIKNNKKTVKDILDISTKQYLMGLEKIGAKSANEIISKMDEIGQKSWAQKMR